MSRTLHITALKGACAEQRALFRKLFGTSVEVTEALAVEHPASFSWTWAANKLLSAAARAEYDKARAAARAECDKVTAAARAECDKVRAPARAEYEKVTAAARAEYNKVHAAAWAECDKVRAAAWARSYIMDGDAA